MAGVAAVGVVGQKRYGGLSATTLNRCVFLFTLGDDGQERSGRMVWAKDGVQGRLRPAPMGRPVSGCLRSLTHQTSGTGHVSRDREGTTALGSHIVQTSSFGGVLDSVSVELSCERVQGSS